MQHTITAADLRHLMSGEGGSDLERIIENGKQVAMKIVGLKPGTVADRLGAKNGDTIETINDRPLDSIPAAYAAAAAAAKEPQIVIRGKRDGAPYETILTLQTG